MVNFLRVKNLTFANMTPLVKNPMISKGYVDIAYSGKNRNRTYISDVVMDSKLKPSIPGVPIVGEYFEEIGDFGDHGGKIIIDSNGIKYVATTTPYGFVPPNTTFRYVDKVDKDGVTRKYLRADCFLWTGQYPECQRVIDSGNPQSMELERDSGSWRRMDGEDYYDIEDAIVTKLCILGSDVEPCFEGAAFGKEEEDEMIAFSYDKEEYDNFIKQFALQVKEALADNEIENEEGGSEEMSLENTNDAVETQVEETIEFVEEETTSETEEQVEEVTEETVVEETNEEEETVIEETEEETVEESTEETTEDISEAYARLAEDCAALTASLEKANDTIAELTHSLEELQTYKAQIESQKKEALFQKFKNKNVIEDSALDSVVAKMDELTYEQLNSELCQLYTYAKMEIEDEVVEEVPSSRVFNLETSELGEMTWEQAVKNRKCN